MSIGDSLIEVSIQLGFPARGNMNSTQFHHNSNKERFHSIGIPSAWELRLLGLFFVKLEKFPFNWDSQRVGTQ